MEELVCLDVNPVLINWIKAFLTNRTQAVRIGNSFSEWKSPNGGISQGTKLGVILFPVITNNLLRNWHLRVKFVDDTTALEILPRNGISLLNLVVNDIQNFSMNHNMKLNPKKCKEMLFNFMHNHNFLIRPIVIGNSVVERVTTYKLLDIIMSDDLKWTKHVDYIFKKASKRLFSLRTLKKAGVASESIVKTYLATVRPILEYGVQVWQDIPDCLSRKLKLVQKRALLIFFPTLASYTEAIYIRTNLTTLEDRRKYLWCNYPSKMSNNCHPINLLIPKQENQGSSYSLRTKNTRTSLELGL